MSMISGMPLALCIDDVKAKHKPTWLTSDLVMWGLPGNNHENKARKKIFRGLTSAKAQVFFFRRLELTHSVYNVVLQYWEQTSHRHWEGTLQVGNSG